MKKVLEVLEEIYIDEIPYIEDMENKYSVEILEYIIDLKLADFFRDEEQETRVCITNKGFQMLQQYEIVD